MTLRPTSIRAKLTLTAVTVMGVLFVVLGFVVQIVGRAEIMAGVDAELSKRAGEIIMVHRQMDHDRPPFPPGGMRGGPDDHGGPGDHHGPEDGPGFGGGQGPVVFRVQGSIQGNIQGPVQPGADHGDGHHHGPDDGPGGRIGGFGMAVQRIGDPLLSIGPRFVAVSPGPPFAPPDMMIPYDKAVLKEAEKKGTVYSNILLGGEKVRLITKLATDDNGRKWMVQFPYPLGDIDKSIQKLGQTLLLLLPVGLALTAMACLFLMKHVMRPVREIRTMADSIGGEDLSRRLPTAGEDEFAQLGGTINGMLGRLQHSFEVQRQTLERLEAILKQQRRFTADASHELKTPLAVIKANTGLMLHGMKLSPDEKGSVEAIDAAAGRMNKLVQGLMALARAESGQTARSPSLVDLNLTVQNAIDHVFRPSGKCLEFHGDEDGLIVNGSEVDLERVFVNLVDNASRHTGPEGKIEVRAARFGTDAVITVADDGEGIAPEHLPNLFDRFYRVDSARSTDTGGTGLGLAICKGIVEAHGGRITIDSKLGIGTTVTVSIPLSLNAETTT